MLKSNDLEAWLNKITRTMDGIHPSVAAYFWYIRKSAGETCEKYLRMNQVGQEAVKISAATTSVKRAE